MPINICKRDLCFQLFCCAAHNTAVSWQLDVAITHDLHSKISSIAKNHRNIISSMNRTSSTSRALQTSEKTNQRKVRELDTVMPHEGHTRTHEPVWKGAPGAACTLVFERILAAVRWRHGRLCFPRREIRPRPLFSSASSTLIFMASPLYFPWYSSPPSVLLG